jgi:hypothetical protein
MNLLPSSQRETLLFFSFLWEENYPPSKWRAVKEITPDMSR